MGVPAHDTRDFQFAAKQLPIQVVIAPTAHHAIEARSYRSSRGLPSLELSSTLVAMAWFPQMLSKQLFNTRKNRVLAKFASSIGYGIG